MVSTYRMHVIPGGQILNASDLKHYLRVRYLQTIYTVHTAQICPSPPGPISPNYIYSPHSADLSKSPWTRRQPLSMAATRGQSAQSRDQQNCPLIWGDLKRQSAVAADCCSFMWQAICTSGLATKFKTLNFFIWANNAINQSNDSRFKCTFHLGRHNEHVS